MKPDYVFWKAGILENVCQLDEFSGVEREWELDEGVPRAAAFIGTAVFRMDERYPYNIMLADCLRNKDRLIVISGGLKQFLESRAVAEVEFLPAAILDHKGRTASNDYFILHPIHPVDCLDIGSCVPRWSAIDKTRIKEIKQFALDETKLDPSRELFRPLYFHRATLTVRNLAKSIDAAGFTGIRWIEPADFSEL